MHVRTAALHGGRLAVIWAGAWTILSVVYKGEQLDMINSVHPSFVGAGLMLLILITEFAVGKIRPGRALKDVPLRKLRTLAQVTLLVLALDLVWANLVEISFPWTGELALMAFLELMLVMDKNSRGLEGGGIRPVTIVTTALTFGLVALVNRFIEPIGQALLSVSMGVKAVLGFLLSIFGKIIVWMVTTFKIGFRASYDTMEMQEQETAPPPEYNTPSENLMDVMRIFVYAVLALIGIVLLAALVYILIERIRAMWQDREEARLFGRETEKKSFLKKAAEFISYLVRRTRAEAKLNRHKDSVGYALYGLEKKYRKNRSLKRKKGETPLTFLTRIEEKESALENYDGERMARLKLAATRAAYDRNYSWLEKL